MTLRQLAFLAAMSFACLQLVAGDVYPGDTTFNNIFSGLRNKVSQNRISFSLLKDVPMTRHGLCCFLTEKFNYIHGATTQSNAGFIGTTISSSHCTGALASPSATLYKSSLAGWKLWQGVHSGRWYVDNGAAFTDKSTWALPVTQYGSGGPYRFQTGTFNSRTGCTFSVCGYGWKKAGTALEVVWAWDPKDSANQGGKKGAHAGYPFASNGINCILWISTEEAFLECIKPIPSLPGSNNRRRAGAGFFGYGQWTVS